MEQEISRKRMTLLLLTGVLGCLLMGGSDWLMIYGDTAFGGQLAWLTEGVARIPAWRNALAMALSFPAVLLYCVALFSVRRFLSREKHRRVYSALTAVGMLPWLCLHLFYTMILFLFAWLRNHGHQADAFGACEALFGQFSWVVLVSEVLMLLPFLYLFYLFVSGQAGRSRWMALNNPLLLYVVLKLITMVMPDVPARLAFTNGLMSEAMLIWFVILLCSFGHTEK